MPMPCPARILFSSRSIRRLSPDGEADLQYVRMAAESISQVLSKYAIIVNKSTVPVGTGDAVAEILQAHGKTPGIDFDIVSNPEFLAEGTAVYDFLQPDRVVLGGTNRDAVDKVAQLYLPLRCTIMTTDLRTAEMIKYASNAFLATRVSFINEIATICEKVGADVKEVAAGMGMDRRIGKAFLNAGRGVWRQLFPQRCQSAYVDGGDQRLSSAIVALGHGNQPRHAAAGVGANCANCWARYAARPSRFGAWRSNPTPMMCAKRASLDIIHLLQTEGAKIRAYDPVATEAARRVVKDVIFCDTAYAAVEDADALVLVTEWNEFKQMDMERVAKSMKQKILIDGRNIYDAEQDARDWVCVSRHRTRKLSSSTVHDVSHRH